MDHYRQEFPGRFIDVSYEDVARDLEPHARALIGALGLDWEDACLNFHESDAGVATASAVQVRSLPTPGRLGVGGNTRPSSPQCPRRWPKRVFRSTEAKTPS
ncbi:MAG: hypothetical protein CM15mP74_36030 [Halieaceae bacterium]|nr:MAG: hypothetical protein CM15mP74_36030 [Halieaceae bacterium]